MRIAMLAVLVAAGCGASPDAGQPDAAPRPVLTPDQHGRINEPTTTIHGAWYAFVDSVRFDGTTYVDGDCQAKGGHDTSECSALIAPDPTAGEFPPSPDLGMCVAGVVAKVIAGPDGMLDTANITGAGIGFTLADGQPYDATAHHVTGLGFDIDWEPPPGAQIRIALPAAGMPGAAASWGGPYAPFSPVHLGHNQLRWGQVGVYGTLGAALDATRLLSVRFEVAPVLPYATQSDASFAFCIAHVEALID
jgi:hypothetical protein